MTHQLRHTISLLFLACAGCGTDADPTAAPAAPSALSVDELAGGAHLTWTDNADNEDEFMIMRQESGVDADFQHVTSVSFDSVQYHDAPLTSGSTYTYMVVAVNADGEAGSDEVSFAAP